MSQQDIHGPLHSSPTGKLVKHMMSSSWLPHDMLPLFYLYGVLMSLLPAACCSLRGVVPLSSISCQAGKDTYSMSSSMRCDVMVMDVHKKNKIGKEVNAGRYNIRKVQLAEPMGSSLMLACFPLAQSNMQLIH
jgi:hypothetical protein